MYFLNIDRKASRIFLNKSDFQQFNLSIELYTNLTSNFTFDLLIELSRIITAFILSFHKVENLLLNTFFIDICTVTGHNFTFTYVQPKLSTRRWAKLIETLWTFTLSQLALLFVSSFVFPEDDVPFRIPSFSKRNLQRSTRYIGVSRARTSTWKDNDVSCTHVIPSTCGRNNRVCP